MRIGELLVQSGVLTESALAEVLERQKTDRRRLGDLLAERDLVEPRRLAQILSYQLACPWLSLTNVDLPRSLLDLFPRELAIKHTMIPVHLRVTRGVSFLYVATHDPTDASALAEAAQAAGMPVRPMVAVTYEIRQALARFYGAPVPSLTTAPITYLAALKAATPGPPVVKQPPPLPPKRIPGPDETAKLPRARISDEPEPAPAPLAAAPPALSAPPPSLRPGRPPTILVLNAPDRFLAQCEIAATSVGASVVEGSLLDAATKVKESTPAAIVVTDDIYGFDRSGLNRLAIESDALLVVWSEEVEASQLEPLLEGAVRRWRRATSLPPPGGIFGAR